MYAPGMTSRTQTTVIFACPKCGIAYQASQQQHPDDHSGSFKCQDCRTEVHAWSGVFSFFDWKAYEKTAENLHRAELTALERDTQIARWVELTAAKVSDTLSETSPNKGGRPGNAAATARDIGVNERDVQRAVASLSPEAKQAARDAGLDDNRAASPPARSSAPPTNISK